MINLLSILTLWIFPWTAFAHIPATYSPFKVLLDVHGYNASTTPEPIGTPVVFRTVQGRRVYGLADTSLVSKTLETAYKMTCEIRDRGTFYVCSKDVPDLRNAVVTRVALICYWDRTELRPPEGYGLKLCMDPVIIARYNNVTLHDEYE